MESLLFSDDQLNETNSTNYLVLARKYRPTTFTDLVGQDVLIKTLTNAITSKRIAHAYILTGIRGVGKTTTARIIARALNCIGEDEKGSITFNPCGKCVHCKAIKDDRHQDVVEIDAASHTGVNDIREIIDNIRYRPVSARFKIYIIDEVHMLSNSAFNALLKTLEEPPAHVKFIFATTEIRKIPLTILSRCQRFDLKRVSIDELVKHFQSVLVKESLNANLDCLKMIATCAEGSVRDGLSILDQAISHTNGNLDSEAVREMLGLSSSHNILKLFHNIVNNEMLEAIEVIISLYKHGVDPVLILQDLMNVTHILAKAIIDIKTLDTLLETDKKLYLEFLKTVDVARLNRIWLALTKGLDEIRLSYNTLVALEMIVIRVAHISNLPSPEDIVRELKNYKDGKIASDKNLKDKPHSNENSLLTSFKVQSIEDIESLLIDNGEIVLCHHLRSDIRLIKIEQNKIIIRILEKAPKNFNILLKEALERITKQNWLVSTSLDEGEQTMAYKEKENNLQKTEEIKSHPLVKSVLNSFTGLEIADIKLKDVI